MDGKFNLPLAWYYRDGYTFRWGRGDAVMTVQVGEHVGGYGLGQVIDQIPVPKAGWQDQSEVQRYAQRWLSVRRQGQPPAPRSPT